MQKWLPYQCFIIYQKDWGQSADNIDQTSELYFTPEKFSSAQQFSEFLLVAVHTERQATVEFSTSQRGAVIGSLAVQCSAMQCSEVK